MSILFIRVRTRVWATQDPCTSMPGQRRGASRVRYRVTERARLAAPEPAPAASAHSTEFALHAGRTDATCDTKAGGMGLRAAAPAGGSSPLSGLWQRFGPGLHACGDGWKASRHLLGPLLPEVRARVSGIASEPLAGGLRVGQRAARRFQSWLCCTDRVGGVVVAIDCKYTRHDRVRETRGEEGLSCTLARRCPGWVEQLSVVRLRCRMNSITPPRGRVESPRFSFWSSPSSDGDLRLTGDPGEVFHPTWLDSHCGFSADALCWTEALSPATVMPNYSSLAIRLQ